MRSDDPHSGRIRFLIGVAIFIGAVSIIKLFYLQIARGSFYSNEAQKQYVSSSGLFDRGNIYFKSKEGETVAAATVANGYKLAIVPGKVLDAQHTYDILNAIVPIDQASFFNSIDKKADPYEEVATHLSEQQGQEVLAAGLPGVNTYRDKWRFYPGGTLASKSIGFVSFKDDKLTGSYGLESFYNDVLTRDSDDLSVNFFAELFGDMHSTTFKNTAGRGDVVTSIEPTVQSELERAVEGVEQRWSSDAVGALVMDPNTGEIIALAHVPTFDPNNYSQVDDLRVYLNPFAQNVYEMGSIIKPIVMASAIDVGAVTPQTTYFDAGSVVINGKTLNNFDKQGRGTATMQDVLNQSLNTGMVFVEGKMGKDNFRTYLLDRFKMGEKTGVDLPGEVNGLVSTLKGTNDVNFASAAFGQGIATTPLAIIRGYAAIANGGHLVTPHLATSIVTEDGAVKELSYEQSKSILKPETIATMVNMMTKVVDDGYHLGLPHYTVAAKTGTAQIARPDGDGYYDDRNLHSLIGFFPAHSPRFVVYFFTYYPKGVRYAVQSLADPFFDMIEFLANYYEIPPDR